MSEIVIKLQNTKLLRYSTSLVLLAICLLVMASRIDAPLGQPYYLLSKYIGLVAIILFWFQLFVAQLVKLSIVRSEMAPGRRFHMLLGTLVVSAIVLHGSLFISAVSLRADHLALHLLIPRLTSGYYELGLSLGVIAMFTVLVAVYFGYRKFNEAFRRIAHRLVYAVFFLGITHALMIGSEANSGIVELLFWLMGISIMGLMSIRAMKAHRSR